MARGKMDWVVNRYTYGGLVDPILLLPGPAGQVGLPLTISDQVRELTLRDGGEVGWGAIPEDWGPRTYAVRGHIQVSTVVPETIGILAARITVHQMDQDTLAPLVSGNYTICGTVPNVAVSADEPFAWEAHYILGNMTNYSIQSFKVDATCNRRLENNEALYIMLESPDPGTDLNIWLNLRTLCAVEDR